MKSVLLHSKLDVKQSPIHGYGVFAAQKIKAGDIIEECYTITTRDADPALEDYRFEPMDGSKEHCLICLGNGSIYNHSETPNAGFYYDREHTLIVFKAKVDINPGEEITVSYGDTWFSSRNLRPCALTWRYRLRRMLSRNAYLLRFSLVVGVIVGLVKLMEFVIT